MGNLFSSNIKKTEDVNRTMKLSNKDTQLDELKALKQKQIRLLLEHLRIQLGNTTLNTPNLKATLSNDEKNIKPSYLKEVLNYLKIPLQRLQLERQPLRLLLQRRLQQEQQLEHILLQPPLDLLELLQSIELQVNHQLPLFLIYRQLQQEYLELKLMYPEQEVNRS